jgi:hypothetical protein
MPLFAAPSDTFVLALLAVFVGIAYLFTATIGRGGAPLRRESRELWLHLRYDSAASDPRWLKAGMLIFSATIATAMVAGSLTVMGFSQGPPHAIAMLVSRFLEPLGSPPGPIVWGCWFGCIALARFVAGPRAVAAVSGLALGAIALYGYYCEAKWSVAARDCMFSQVVLTFAFAFGLGYGLSAFMGGIFRFVRWLLHSVGKWNLH